MWTQSGKYIIPILTTIVAGCTTMGTGTGSTPSGGSPTVFSWESSDGVTGTMSATMPGGQTYHGQYFQITKTTTVDSIGPLWVAGVGRMGRSRWLGLGLLGRGAFAGLHHALFRARGGESRPTERRSYALSVSACHSRGGNERRRSRPMSIA